MEVIVGKNAGFCFGVTNAVKKTEEELEKNKNKRITYCLGELAHNSQVMDRLVSSGLVVVEDIEQVPKLSNLIIRAHGIGKDMYDKINEKKINIIDLTCPRVAAIHKIVEEYLNKDYFILILGTENHPEVIGTVGFCGDKHYVIENAEEVEDFLKFIKDTKISKLLVVAQTTYSIQKFDLIIDILKTNIDIELEIKRTICEATNIRQLETEELSQKVDLMIIIGGKKSSNTQKLYDIAFKNAPNAICAETIDDIDLEEIKKYSKIGIMAGASTPQFVIEEVVYGISK